MKNKFEVGDKIKASKILKNNVVLPKKHSINLTKIYIVEDIIDDVMINISHPTDGDGWHIDFWDLVERKKLKVKPKYKKFVDKLKDLR